MRGGLLKKLAISTALVSGFCAGARATEPASASRYDLIPQRNVFKLREPPQQPTVAPTNPPLAKVNLLGISTLHRKLAFLKLAGASKPGGPGAEQSLMLGEGQRDGDIEVVEINERAGLVRIRKGAESIDLTFEKDGLKSNPPSIVNSTGPLVPGENPPTMQGSTPSPTQNPAAPLAPAPTAPQPNLLNKRTLPSRNLNVSPPPLPTMQQPANPATTAPAQPSNQLSPEEQQQLLNEIERLKTSPY